MYLHRAEIETPDDVITSMILLCHHPVLGSNYYYVSLYYSFHMGMFFEPMEISLRASAPLYEP